MFKKIGLDLHHNHINLIELDEFSTVNKFKEVKTYYTKNDISTNEYFMELKDALKAYMKKYGLKSIKLNIVLPHDIKDVYINFKEIPEDKEKNIKKMINNELKTIYNSSKDFKYRYGMIFSKEAEAGINLYNLQTISTKTGLLRNIAELKSLNVNIENVYFKPSALATVIDKNSIVIDSTTKDLYMYLYNEESLVDIIKVEHSFFTVYEQIKDILDVKLDEMVSLGVINYKPKITFVKESKENVDKTIKGLKGKKKRVNFKLRKKSKDKFEDFDQEEKVVLDIYDLKLLIAILFKDFYLEKSSNQMYLEETEVDRFEVEEDIEINNIEPKENKPLSFEERLKYFHNKQIEGEEQIEEEEEVIEEPVIENKTVENFDDSFTNLLDYTTDIFVHEVIRTFNRDLEDEKIQLILILLNSLSIPEKRKIRSLITEEVDEFTKTLVRQVRSLAIQGGFDVSNIHYLLENTNLVIIKMVMRELSKNMLDMSISELKTMDQFLYKEFDESKMNSFFAELALNDLSDIEVFNFIKDTKKNIDFTALGLILLLSAVTFNLALNFSGDKINDKILQLEDTNGQQSSVISSIKNELEKYNASIESHNQIVKMANEITDEQKWLSEILYLIPGRTPKELSVKHIDIDANEAIIFGYAKDYIDIGWFVMQLEDLGEVELLTVDNVNEEDAAVGKGEVLEEDAIMLDKTFKVKILSNNLQSDTINDDIDKMIEDLKQD